MVNLVTVKVHNTSKVFNSSAVVLKKSKLNMVPMNFFNDINGSGSRLIQKEKVHIDCEKGLQISILAKKIATQWWPNIIIKESKQTINYIYFLFACHYVLHAQNTLHLAKSRFLYITAWKLTRKNGKYLIMQLRAFIFIYSFL